MEGKHADVVCQALSSIHELCKFSNHLCDSAGKTLEAAAMMHLLSADHRVRALSLRIISFVSQNQTVISASVKDPDSRVRVAALQSLLTLHHRGTLLSVSLYDLAQFALRDDIEEVRYEAITLILSVPSPFSFVFLLLSHHFRAFFRSAMSQLYSKTKLFYHSHKVRLVDDGFVKICDMVNDTSIRVRTKVTPILFA